MLFNQAAYFLSGGVMALSLVATIFFARFRARTGERLFTVFAIVFGLLTIERCALLFVGGPGETRGWMYLIRFAAYLILVIGIVDKNRRGRRG